MNIVELHEQKCAAQKNNPKKRTKPPLQSQENIVPKKKPKATVEMPAPKKQYQATEKMPELSIRFDLTLGHLPKIDKSTRVRCKYEMCGQKSSISCTECNVHLCICTKSERNCFTDFHTIPTVPTVPIIPKNDA